jgi:hypothetical protein
MPIGFGSPPVSKASRTMYAAARPATTLSRVAPKA